MEDFFQLFWLGFVDSTSFAYAITSMGIAFIVGYLSQRGGPADSGSQRFTAVRFFPEGLLYAATEDNRVFAYELSGYTAFLLGVRSVVPYATMTKIGWRCLV